MIVLAAPLAALLLSVIILFVNSFLIKIILIILLLLSLFLQWNFMRRMKKSQVQESESDDTTIDVHDENRRLISRIAEMEESTRNLTMEKQALEERLDTLIEEASDLCTALPMMKKLAHLIIDKTEESAINLTESIFQISTHSSQVGGHISNYLVDLFSGERSLKNNIETLGQEMKEIETLITDFQTINKQYTVDMKQIEESVHVINGFLTGIRDVSDRTGLLAINSSIEAARVGAAGKGFSVLAGEIQGLASSSRDLSLQIDEVVEGISSRVEESFDTLAAEISKTQQKLSSTDKQLRDISINLEEKISQIESHVKRSETLSKTVTEQLNNVSVNMQYQDITRQILEHIMGLLNFYRVKMEEKEPKLISETDKRDKKQKILEKASTYFTIEEEWSIFGLDIAVSSAPEGEKDEEYKGDVELF